MGKDTQGSGRRSTREKKCEQLNRHDPELAPPAAPCWPTPLTRGARRAAAPPASRSRAADGLATTPPAPPAAPGGGGAGWRALWGAEVEAERGTAAAPWAGGGSSRSPCTSSAEEARLLRAPPAPAGPATAAPPAPPAAPATAARRISAAVRPLAPYVGGVERRLPAEALAAVAAGAEPPNADTRLLAASRSWCVGSQ